MGKYPPVPFSVLRKKSSLVTNCGSSAIWIWSGVDVSLTPEATLCIPKEIDADMEANAGNYIHEVARHCALWLLTSQAVAKV